MDGQVFKNGFSYFVFEKIATKGGKTVGFVFVLGREGRLNGQLMTDEAKIELNEAMMI